MSPRVLQVTPSYPPVVGGIEDHVANLVERLPEFGYEPLVLTPDREGVGDDEGVHREPVRLRIQKSAVAPGVLRRLFTLEYDLIHVHAPFHFGLEFAALASKLRGIPMVVTVHMYDARETFLYSLYEDQVYDRCLDAADRIVPTTRDYVEGYEVFERNAERVRAVPLGVDTNRYRPIESARERLGWDSDERILLFVGAMERHHFYKNVEGLIDAVAETEKVDRLVLVGSGDLVPKLKQKVNRDGIDDKINFSGYVPEDNLPTYYSASDVFVLPSKADRGEAFGIVLLEAMACGTPVVTTDIPGVRTVVGEGGVVVPPDDTEALIDGVTEALNETFMPRNRAEGRYSIETVLKQVESVYDNVLNESGNGDD